MSEKKVEWRVWNKYEVSSEGMVRRAAPGRATQMGRELKRTVVGGRVLYGMMVKGQRVTISGARLMAEVWLGGLPPAGSKVGFRDGNKENLAVGNLEIVPSRKVRVPKAPQDRKRSGPKPKLTDEQVREIRRMWKAREDAWMTGGMIAKKFGVSESMVNRIVHRRAWAHLE